MAEKRYTFVFLIAVVIALAATAGVFRALRAIREGNHVAMAQVVVANRDIPEGQQLERRDLETAVWPAASVPAGAFASGDSLVGRVTRVSVFTGEPIVPGRLAPVGTGAGIEVKITPGKRAMAIRIDDVAGMAGLIQPNSRVDIMVSMRDEGSGSQQGKRVAKLFMENMRVLSVGTQVYRDENGKPIRAASATLEVTPEEAERLAIAVGTGAIQLVLRGYGDPDSIKTRGATSSDVLSQLRTAPVVATPEQDPPAPVRHHVVAAKPAPPPPTPAPVVVVKKPKAPDSVTVQVFRAGKVSQQHFERDSAAADSASQ